MFICEMGPLSWSQMKLSGAGDTRDGAYEKSSEFDKYIFVPVSLCAGESPAKEDPIIDRVSQGLSHKP